MTSSSSATLASLSATPSPSLTPSPSGTSNGAASSLLNPPQAPTTIWVSWSWNRLGALDPVDGHFDLDGYLSMAWVDDRLDNNTFDMVYAGYSGEPSTSNFFVPWPELVNQEFQLLNNPPIWQAWFGAPAWAADPACVGVYGPLYGANTSSAVQTLTWVQLYGRVAATFFASFRLEDFPFDTQLVPFALESTSWPVAQVVYRGAPQAYDAIISSSLYVPGFNVQYAYSQSSLVYYDAWKQNYSHWAAVAVVTRNSSYYTRKSMANIILLVLMSAVASFLRPNDANRATIQLTLFLGIVSWVFVLSNDSPRGQSTTRMDNFVNASFAVIFVMFFYHSATLVFHHRVSKKKQQKKNGDGDGDIELVSRVGAAVGSAVMMPGVSATLRKKQESLAQRGHVRVAHSFGAAGGGDGGGTASTENPLHRPVTFPLSTDAAPGAPSKAPSDVPQRRRGTPPMLSFTERFCGVKSTIRARDIVVTTVILLIYGMTVGILMSTPTPLPQLPHAS